ncbi:TPA: hypothetical protein NG572_001297 [Vibrio parahaemolyticus]|nr:hypothetical protein [Vibrio parahaemolyticus]HCM1217635.1 hypothetical protein [Vibrio parahaemolyticus]
MNAVWKWIKGALLAAVVTVIATLWLALKASHAEQALLATELESANRANVASQRTIQILEQDQAAMNQLLVQRAKTKQQTRRQLNEQVAELTQKMANTECDIPDDVTGRLREPY